MKFGNIGHYFSKKKSYDDQSLVIRLVRREGIHLEKDHKNQENQGYVNVSDMF